MEPTPPTSQTTPAKKFSWPILVIVIGLIVVLAIAVLVLTQQSTPTTTDNSTASPQTTASPTTSAITSDSELQSASTELDKVDLDSVDSGLTQNDSDAAQF